MKIGGFQKNTLIDFPGTIACIVFTRGCNLYCPYCHNPELVAASAAGSGNIYEQDNVFKFLEKRKGLVEGVVISGGEPTLQSGLEDFCQKIKDMGYRLKMDTNGTRPEIIERLLAHRLLDFVAMDIKTVPENYHMLSKEKPDPEKIYESIRILMETAPDYEFRTTCVSPFIDMDIMENIGSMIKGARACILQKCSRTVDVLDPEFLAGEDHFFSDDQMMKLQDIISGYVDKTFIR